MSKDNFDIVVLIPTYKRPELLERTLSSLAECEKPANFKETIVIENGGKFGAEEIVNKFKKSLNARYLYIEEGNKSLALNLALNEIDDCLVFFTDDDIRFDKKVLIVYSKVSNEINRGKFFGGRVKIDYESEPEGWLMAYLPFSVKGFKLDNNDRKIVKPVFLGCNWAAYLSDIQRSGGFDPEYGMGSNAERMGEETFMQKKLLQSGLTGQYIPDACVWHYVPMERCTPEWAKERSYKSGIYHGVNLNKTNKTFFGVPFSLILSLFWNYMYLMIRVIIGPNEKRKWAQLSSMPRIKGIIHGYKLKWDNSTKDKE